MTLRLVKSDQKGEHELADLMRKLGQQIDRSATLNDKLDQLITDTERLNAENRALLCELTREASDVEG